MEKYFRYLEQLRDSGKVNMYGAVPYLQRKFPELGFDGNRAQEILVAWMNSFSEKDKGRQPYCEEAGNGG